MGRTLTPDFERYMTALRCKEPDRVPLGDFVIDQLPKESFLGKKLEKPPKSEDREEVSNE